MDDGRVWFELYLRGQDADEWDRRPTISEEVAGKELDDVIARATRIAMTAVLSGLSVLMQVSETGAPLLRTSGPQGATSPAPAAPSDPDEEMAAAGVGGRVLGQPTSGQPGLKRSPSPQGEAS